MVGWSQRVEGEVNFWTIGFRLNLEDQDKPLGFFKPESEVLRTVLSANESGALLN